MTYNDTGLGLRILQNAFEETELQENSISETEYSPVVIFIVIIPFFVVWNCFIGAPITLGLSFLLRGRFDESLISLICPHWVVGIYAPALAGYAWRGMLGVCITLGFTVVIPCGYHFAYHALANEELNSLPLCCCATRETVSPQPTTVPRPQNDDANCETSGTQEEGEEEKEGEEEEHQEEGEEEEEDSLLTFKKVLPPKAAETSSADDCSDRSFRSNHPKSDIYALSKTARPSPPASGKESRAASNQTCAVCLDEYQAGESIAWSRNPNCHHVFHKACVLELLGEGHDACPICRQSYFVLSDVELGHS